MGEVQEQRYICKICNKSCVSGKSLGGHMRVHLALIAASKKEAKLKAEIKFDVVDDDVDDDQDGSYRLKENSMNQSNSDFGDGDQTNSYELRENPKKSWRISDSKHGVSKNYGNSCKECGKDFPSLRALSGHMRSHSIKNKKVHQCQKCGKGFDSVRAMFGHMKSHSKKSRMLNESTDSLSELENLCPVRRKRSRIKYKSASNPSFSDINVSNCTVSDLGEVEEAARCLIMLSRGVRDCLKLETESSDDDSVYFGAESSFKTKKFSGYGGDFLSDVEKNMKMSLLSTEKNVSEFDDLDSKFVVEDQMKVDAEVSDVELPSVENEIKADFVSADGQLSVHRVMESDKSYEFVDCADDYRSSDFTKSAKFDKDFLVATSKSEGSSKFFESISGKEVITSVHQSDSGNKIFHSHHVLGSKSSKHKMRENSSAVYRNTSLLYVTEDDSKIDQIECGDNQIEQESISVETVSLESSKSKEHECPICFKIFSSGQALGGHKRSHYNGFAEIKNQETKIVMNREVAQVEEILDLNFPVTVDEGKKSELGLNSSWWIDRSREHEALVLTN